MKKAWVIQRKNDGSEYAGKFAHKGQYIKILQAATVFKSRQTARDNISNMGQNGYEVVRRVELDKNGRPKRIIKMKKAWVIQRKNDGSEYAGKFAHDIRYTRTLQIATVFKSRQMARDNIASLKLPEVVRRVELGKNGRPKRIIEGR